MSHHARFTGKVVLVTGAAGGFGRRAAERFADEGARLAISDVAADRLDEVAQDLRRAGAEVVAEAGDVSQESTAERLVAAALGAYGRLDVALNNAGMAHPYLKLPDIPSETAERVIAVDLMGVFYAMKHQLPAMERQGGGVILNVASVAGLVGAPLLSVYAAAKHGVVGLTKTAAVEYARRNIRVNAICPSFADAAMVKDELAHMRGGPEAALERVLGGIPMRRLANVDEIVAAMLQLCGPESAFITGVALPVDGGLTAA
jgi:NAD(P)-dependent dehydrogenase (short-subunit alcohol dehydrogenase family)